MDHVENNKDHTNQTGGKSPGTDNLFKQAYFRIAVFIVRHGDGLTILQDDDGTPAPPGMWLL